VIVEQAVRRLEFTAGAVKGESICHGVGSFALVAFTPAGYGPSGPLLGKSSFATSSIYRSSETAELDFEVARRDGVKRNHAIVDMASQCCGNRSRAGPGPTIPSASFVVQTIIVSRPLSGGQITTIPSR